MRRGTDRIAGPLLRAAALALAVALAPWLADPGLAAVRTDEGGQAPLTLTYVANMGVLVTCGDTKVLIDALFDKPNPVYRAPAPSGLDAMVSGTRPFDGVDLALVTHGHPDHFAPTVTLRFLEARPGVLVVAPADAVADVRKAAAGPTPGTPRLISLDLAVGEHVVRENGKARVQACRTRHSGNLESPSNLMYLVEMDGWRVFHEGDSPGSVEAYEQCGFGNAPVDLAIVSHRFPMNPDRARFLRERFKPAHVALAHVAVDFETEALSNLERIRAQYPDIFLLMPGMAPRVFRAGDRRPVMAPE